MLTENTLASDIIATVFSGGVALSLLKLWEETAKRHIFEQKLNRKLVHVSVGLAFMLCWPLFSSGWQGALIAALIPGINIIKMLLIGLGIYKDEDTVKSMSRFGNHRELLKGPLYYAATITLASVIYWRTSPIGVAAICNLCAGDGLADIIGRRFGNQKLPYNKNKSVAGSIAMVTAGFLVSIGFMHYFSLFGYVQESWEMALGFLVVSLATALVESHPLSTELDDNLTVPLASIVVTDNMMLNAANIFRHNTPTTKEACYYHMIFEMFFPQNSAMMTVPGGASVAYSTAKAVEWNASWSKNLDPSGRAALGVHLSAYQHQLQKQRLPTNIVANNANTQLTLINSVPQVTTQS